MSMRMDGGTPTDLTGIAGQARAWLGQLQSQLADAGAQGSAVSNGLRALTSTIDAITAAKGKAAIVATDPMLVASFKLQKVRDLVGSAYADATRAVLDLSSAIDKARTQLAKGIIPSKPSGADAAMLPFQAQEVTKVLEGAGERQYVVVVATQLLKDALASGDDALAYVIAGPLLKLTYQRLGVNEAALYQSFAQTFGEAAAQSSAPGAALLAYLQAGGSGTLCGLVDVARIAITRDQQAYQAWLAQSASVGALNGIWDKGGKAPAQ